MTTDRDDELIDRIEAGIAPANDDEAVARAPYERLIGRLKELDRREPPAGWAERVDARVRVERDHERRRRRRLWAGGVAAALGAAIVVVIVVRGGDERTPPAGTASLTSQAHPAGDDRGQDRRRQYSQPDVCGI